MKYVYRSKQNSIANSKTKIKSGVSKHSWLLNGSKYNRMRLAQKDWEKTVIDKMHSTLRDRGSNEDISQLISSSGEKERPYEESEEKRLKPIKSVNEHAEDSSVYPDNDMSHVSSENARSGKMTNSQSL